MKRATLLLLALGLFGATWVSVQAQTPENSAYATSDISHSVEGGLSKDAAPDPVVYLIAPTSNASYIAPAAPMFYVSAFATAASSATIDHVDFIDGNIVIGTVKTPNADPAGHGYAFAWVNPALGTHIVYARAVDSLGNAATSRDSITGLPNPVRVSIVAPRIPPSVTLTSPSTGQTYAPASSVALSADVIRGTSNLQRVEFLSSNVVIGTATVAPYAARWDNPPPGHFAIVAKAYDVLGLGTASAAAYIQVLQANRPPGVVLTAPAPGSTLSTGQSVMLAADALSLDDTIARVDFFAESVQLGTSSASPYSFAWTPTAAGPVALSAKAYDRHGNGSASASVGIIIANNTVPIVTLTAPASTASFFAPATIGFTAGASEVGGAIARVDFIANGAIVGTTTSAPYDYSWTGVGAGTYALAARATDQRGISSTTGVTTVVVSANAAPTVTLTAPAAGRTFAQGQPILMSATASDVDGTVARVEFLADGVIVGSSTAPPYTFSLTSLPAGQHQLSARATDNRGATTTSGVVAVTVTPQSTFSVALSSPRDGQTFNAGAVINLVASATGGAIPVDHMEFYADGVELGASASSPFAVDWTSASAGSHTLFARAIDRSGGHVDSANVSVSVQVLPTGVSITSPSPNATVAADFVLVTGTYQAPANSGITVNGVVARTDGQGRFFVNNLALSSGVNTLTVALMTPDGQSTSKTQSITSTGNAPMQLSADTDVEFAPHTFTIQVENRTGNAITNIAYAELDGGQLDSSVADQTTLGKIAYTAPGVRVARLVITDSLGNIYTQSVALLAQDKVSVDQMFKAIWAGFSSALASGDVAKALKAMSGNAQVRYGPVFAKIAPSLATAVASMEPPQTGTLGDRVSEYTVRRMVRGANHVYFVYFLRDPNGIWQLDSM